GRYAGRVTDSDSAVHPSKRRADRAVEGDPLREQETAGKLGRDHAEIGRTVVLGVFGRHSSADGGSGAEDPIVGERHRDSRILGFGRASAEDEVLDAATQRQAVTWAKREGASAM